MSPEKKARKTRKLSSRAYSTGQMNKIIDDLLHPFYERNQRIRVADGILHGILERNVQVSAKKFIRYNLPEIVKEIIEKL